jgi:hypothetical protein
VLENLQRGRSSLFIDTQTSFASTGSGDEEHDREKKTVYQRNYNPKYIAQKVYLTEVDNPKFPAKQQQYCTVMYMLNAPSFLGCCLGVSRNFCKFHF